MHKILHKQQHHSLQRTNNVVLVVDGTNKLCAGIRWHLPLTEDPSLHVGIEIITTHV